MAIIRVTIDLDICLKNSSKFKKAIINLKKYCGSKIYYRRSANKKGYHLLSNGYNYSFEKVCKIRKLCGDDVKRIKIDKIRYKAGLSTQILFDKKGNKKAGAWKCLRQ